MGRRVKLFDDEILAKRIYTKIEKASKSSYNYKKSNSKQEVNYSKKQTNHARSKEVVVKITGSSKNYQQWQKHFDYNTRAGNLIAFEDEFITYKGKEDLEKLKEFFNDSGLNIPNEGGQLREKREVIHFVFSMKEHEIIPSSKLLRSVMKTVKEKYPNNASYFVFHGDTDNPHIHCDLKITSDDGKRIDVRKAD